MDIESKKEILSNLKIHLKSMFLGIDNEIDAILKAMSPWYLFPELIDRPHIICLWGMTGTGKTSLVQEIVEFLEMGTRFTTSVDTWTMRVMDITPTTPYIVLLDECQTRATRNIDGSRKEQSYSSSMPWEYLSSGVVSHGIGKVRVKKNDKGKDYVENSQSIFEYMTSEMDTQDMISFYTDLSKKCDIKLPKALVFICGNLDELYTGTDDLDDEADADMFYEASLSITFEDARNVLYKYFFPEHISRMGSNHIIYPAFSSSVYKEIIRQRISSAIQKICKSISINITYTENVIEHIYNTYVIPSQGARPIISAVDSFVGTYILNAICDFQGDIHIDYSNNNMMINSIEVPFSTLFKKKSIWDYSEDEIYGLMVHESGHVAVSIALGVTPYSSRIKGNGEAITTYVSYSPSMISDVMDSVCILLAGREAEQITIGDISIGCNEDIERATHRVASYVRHHINDAYSSRNENNGQNAVEHGQSNIIINSIMEQQRKRANNILTNEGNNVFNKSIELFKKHRRISHDDMLSLNVANVDTNN